MLAYRAVQPSSERDPNLEQYEFMLVWFNPGGGVRQWLFTQTNVRESEDFNLDILETSSDIRSIPTEEIKTVQIAASSLSKDEFEYIKSILRSNQVSRVSKDCVFTKIGVLSSRIRQNIQQKEYSIIIEIQFKEDPVLNV